MLARKDQPLLGWSEFPLVLKTAAETSVEDASAEDASAEDASKRVKKRE